MFDAQSFLTQQTLDTKLETQFSPIPAGEYVAMIQKIDAREQPKPDGTGVWTILEVSWQVDDARAREATGMATPTVRDSVFLDVANGKLETGKNKNIGLGRLLDAVGIGPGDNPFQQLPGKAAKLQLVVEPDKKDATKIYNRVKAIGKL